MTLSAAELGARFPALVSAMTDRERVALLGLLGQRSFKKGEALVRAGTPSAALLLVLDGELTLRLEQGESSLELGRVPPGRWVGELGLLRPGRRRSRRWRRRTPPCSSSSVPR